MTKDTGLNLMGTLPSSRLLNLDDCFIYLSCWWSKTVKFTLKLIETIPFEVQGYLRVRRRKEVVTPLKPPLCTYLFVTSGYLQVLFISSTRTGIHLTSKGYSNDNQINPTE